jgi:hypothetical protein
MAIFNPKNSPDPIAETPAAGESIDDDDRIATNLSEIDREGEEIRKIDERFKDLRARLDTLEEENRSLKREKAIDALRSAWIEKNGSELNFETILRCVPSIDLDVIGSAPDLARFSIDSALERSLDDPRIQEILNPAPREPFRMHMAKSYGFSIPEPIDENSFKGYLKSQGVFLSENSLLPDDRPPKSFREHLAKRGLFHPAFPKND